MKLYKFFLLIAATHAGWLSGWFGGTGEEKKVEKVEEETLTETVETVMSNEPVENKLDEQIEKVTENLREEVEKSLPKKGEEKLPEKVVVEKVEEKVTEEVVVEKVEKKVAKKVEEKVVEIPEKIAVEEMEEKLETVEPLHRNKESQIDGILDKDEVKALKDLSPKEQVKWMESMFAKIDSNGDGLMGEDEIVGWIRKSEKKHMEAEVKDIFESGYDLDNDKKLSIAECRRMHGYSRMNDFEKDIVDSTFNAADTDSDEFLDHNEALAFFNPQHYENTKPTYLRDMIGRYDADNDGLITLSEYTAEHLGDETVESTLEEETEYFHRLDIDGNGMLNGDELKAWFLPEDHDPAQNEFGWLLSFADSDKNGHLDLDEVLANYNIFAESQTTRWGEMRHDEL